MNITAFASPADAIAAHVARLPGETHACLDRLIGRPRGFLSRFVRDGVPSRLMAGERATLARSLGADERDLGAENVPGPAARPQAVRQYDWFDARNRVA